MSRSKPVITSKRRPTVDSWAPAKSTAKPLSRSSAKLVATTPVSAKKKSVSARPVARAAKKTVVSLAKRLGLSGLKHSSSR